MSEETKFQQGREEETAEDQLEDSSLKSSNKWEFSQEQLEMRILSRAARNEKQGEIGLRLNWSERRAEDVESAIFAF